MRCFFGFHNWVPSYYQDPAVLLREVCLRCGRKRQRDWPTASIPNPNGGGRMLSRRKRTTELPRPANGPDTASSNRPEEK